MSNTIPNPFESLKDKLQSQLLLLTESKDRLNIHLDLLQVDLKRGLDSSYLTKQARINHLEKAENNIIQHIFFIEDLLSKIGGFRNVSDQEEKNEKKFSEYQVQ